MTQRTLTAAPAIVAGLLGAAGLAAWISGRLVLASAHQRFIPMAPATAVAFLLLAAALLALSARKAQRPAAAAGLLVALFAVGKLAAGALGGSALPDVETVFVKDAGAFGVVPLGRISPVTAAGLAALGASVVLTALTRGASPNRDYAGALGAAAGLLGSVIVLGYAYGTPLLYGGSTIPVALPTGVALTASGVAALAAAGPDAWPSRPFMGSSARARLLRAFLPATTAAFLLAGAGGHALVTRMHANPALAAALSTLAAAAFVTALVGWIARRVGIALDRAEQTLRSSQDELERCVAARTAELRRANEELEAFSYSVSHDLRAPLRHIAGFASLLQRSAAATLAPQDSRYVAMIVDAAQRMSRLIDDLLSFSRMGRTELLRSTVDLEQLVDEVIAEERTRTAPERAITWNRGPLPSVSGDRAMLRVALTNLVANAIKYSSARPDAHVEIGALPVTNGEHVLYVRDNGVGFDMQYAGKLFGVFQRLHGAEEFDGIGLGLANVRRVIQRHGGRTWGEGVPGQGATFYIALPKEH